MMNINAPRLIVSWGKRVVLLLVVLTIMLFAGGSMGLFSGKRPKLGITEDGQLMPVDNKPRNSVSSFAADPANQIAPLAAGNDPIRSFQILGNLLETIKGVRVLTRDDQYIRCEFETPRLKFIDDTS